jgi:dephospho-CoA kinase
MTAEDFEARAANQPTDEWLLAHASSVIDNSGTAAELDEHIKAWWQKKTGRLQEGEQS